jgi:5-formyltetrahydrofolate cyclo-ligase
LRRRLRARRARFRDPGRRRATVAAGRHLLSLLAPTKPASIACFWPLPGEFDTRRILHKLADRGFDLCLPRVVGRNMPLEFRRWRPGDVLQCDSFGVRTPVVAKPELVPNIIVTPLLAVDRSGQRLGYGGGYYDRTLASLREQGDVTAVGIGFDFQYFHRIPHDLSDQPVDWLVTESTAYEFSNGVAKRRRGRGIC